MKHKKRFDSFFTILIGMVFISSITLLFFKNDIAIQYLNLIVLALCLIYFFKIFYINNFSAVSTYDFKESDDNFEKVIIDLKAIKIETPREIEKYVEDESIEAQLKTISRGSAPKIKDVWNHFTLKIPYKSGYFQYELKTKLDIYKLKMHFELKGETDLYVQVDNPKIKRLDLGFLD